MACPDSHLQLTTSHRCSSGGGALYNDGRYLNNNPNWHAEDSSWKARQIIKALRKLGVTPRSVCDIGCGAGEVIRCLAKKMPTCEFHGYELSPQAYSLAKARETDRCRYFQLDGLHHRHRDTYDVAMAIDVVEHVEDYFAFLRKLKVIATYKVLHVPLEMSALGVIADQPAWAREMAGHLHYFSSGTLCAALRECGLQNEQMSYTKAFSAHMQNARSASWERRTLLKLVTVTGPRHLLYALSPRVCARILGGCSMICVSQ